MEPSNLTEKVGAALGIPSSQVKGDLERFRDFIEGRGTATGGWRGEVERPGMTGAGSTAGAGIGQRELSGAGVMGASRTGMPGDDGAGPGGATADDPYGIGAGPTAYDTGTASGGSLPGDVGTGLDNPYESGAGRRGGDLDR